MSGRKRVAMVFDLTDEGTVFPVPVEHVPWTGMPSLIDLADAVVEWLQACKGNVDDRYDNDKKLASLANQIEQARKTAGDGDA